MKEFFLNVIAKVRESAEDGITAIEYALLATLIGAVVAFGAMALGNQVNTQFGTTKDCVAGTSAASTGGTYSC